MRAFFWALTLKALLSLSFGADHQTAETMALDLADQSYDEVRELSLSLIGDNPDKVVLIGIGRSPTPFQAFLSIAETVPSFQIPLSGFRADQNGVVHNPLAPEREAKFFALMDRYIPSEAETAGKKIVLYDFSLRGDTLASFSQYLKKYFALKNRSETIELVTLCSSFDEGSILKQFSKFGEVAKSRVLRPFGSLQQLLNHQEADLLSIVPEYFLESGQDIPEISHSNRYYAELQNRYRTHLQTDTGFGAWWARNKPKVLAAKALACFTRNFSRANSKQPLKILNR